MSGEDMSDEDIFIVTLFDQVIKGNIEHFVINKEPWNSNIERFKLFIECNGPRKLVFSSL